MHHTKPMGAGAGPRAAPAPGVNAKIDVCRGLFAVLVVVAHGFEITWPIHEAEMRRLPRGLRDFLFAVPGAGIYWVMGFFVISGYCIHLSVSRLQQEGEPFPLTTYLAARLTRIFPLYYAALLFAVVVEWLIAGARPGAWPGGVNRSALVAQLFCLQNLTQTYGSFAPSWSITNEFFYYLSYGLLACPLMRRRDLLSGAALLICLAVAVAFQVLYAASYRSPFVYSTGMLFGLGIFWSLGAFVAQHSRTVVQSPRLRAVARAWPALLALGVYWKYNANLPLQGFYILPGLAFVLMLVRFLQEPARPAGHARPAWRSRLAQGLGLLSYPMYLFHAPFMMLVGSAILRWRLVSDWRFTWAILTFAGLAVGVALAYLAEKPTLAWRAGLLRRWKTAPRPADREVPAFAGRRGLREPGVAR